MMKKRREEAQLKIQGIEENEPESDTQDEREEAKLPPPNGFGGSPGDYMREKLKQIPAEKVEKMLGRYPQVLAEMNANAS